MRVLGQKKYRGAQNAFPPACLELSWRSICINLYKSFDIYSSKDTEQNVFLIPTRFFCRGRKAIKNNF